MLSVFGATGTGIDAAESRPLHRAPRAALGRWPGAASAGHDVPAPGASVGVRASRSMRAVLDRKTLVLNRSWSPVTTTTVRRAIVLMARGAAGAVDPGTFELSDWAGWIERASDGARRIRSVGFEFPVPEVIVLRAYNGMARQSVPYTRRNVYRRDSAQCQYCAAMPGMASLTIDHVRPRSRGGATTWENCVTACARCNARKADRTLDESGFSLLRLPRAPSWPGGLDPRSLMDRPAWHRFLPRGRVRALLSQLPDRHVRTGTDR